MILSSFTVSSGLRKWSAGWGTKIFKQRAKCSAVHRWECFWAAISCANQQVHFSSLNSRGGWCPDQISKVELKQLQAACLWCVGDEYESPADSLRRSVKVKFVSVPFHVQNTSVTFQRFLLYSSCRLDTTTLSLWGQRSERSSQDHVCWETAKVNQGQSCSCIFTSAVESYQTCKNHFITAMINFNTLPTGSTGTFPSVPRVILAFYCEHYSEHQEGNATLRARASGAPPSLANRLSPQRPQPADARLKETQILTCSHPLSLRVSQHSVDLLLCRDGVKTLKSKDRVNQRVRGFSPDSPVWTHACEVSWWFLAACEYFYSAALW